MSTPPPKVNPNRVLFVNDDEDWLTLLKMRCEKEGIQSDISVNPIETLKTIQENQYSLVVVDLRMPKISGKEFVELLRNKVTTPIAVMTGYTKEDAEEMKVATELMASNLITGVFPKTTALGLVSLIKHYM